MFSTGYLLGFLIVIPYWYFVLYRPKKKHIEKKSEEEIAVFPKNYRKIILHFINSIESPVVKYNRKVITDFSEQGLLTQKGIRKCRDFEILSKKEAILGFHDHPNEMWVIPTHIDLVRYCAKKGWLKFLDAY